MPDFRVSIALATYNGALYLEEQLHSLANQQRLPDELVVSDDCSKDGSVDVVQQFARRAPFEVKLAVKARQAGYNANFGSAIAACTGDVILTCDQDDVWLGTHVQALVDPIEHDGRIGLVVSNSIYVDESLRPIGQTIWSAERFSAQDFRRTMTHPQFPGWLRHKAVAGHGMAFRSSLRTVVLPVCEDWGYDHWIALLAVAVSRAVVLSDALTLHRQHGTQTIANRQLSLLEQRAQTPTLSKDRVQHECDRWDAVRRRLREHSDRLLDPSYLYAVDKKVNLLELRRDMRRGSPGRRIALACKALISGQYHHVGRGWLTFARDLVG